MKPFPFCVKFFKCAFVSGIDFSKCFCLFVKLSRRKQVSRKMVRQQKVSLKIAFFFIELLFPFLLSMIVLLLLPSPLLQLLIVISARDSEGLTWAILVEFFFFFAISNFSLLKEHLLRYLFLLAVFLISILCLLRVR